MGNLVWHDWARLVSIHACIYAVWAGYWGIFYRKYFWDFVGGTMRDPGGTQAPNSAAFFIMVIIKAPVLQILTMISGLGLLALEWPLPLIRGTIIHRSIALRAVGLLIQAFITVFFYQGTNVAIYSLIAAIGYIRALALGEQMNDSKENIGKSGFA